MRQLRALGAWSRALTYMQSVKWQYKVIRMRIKTAANQQPTARTRSQSAKRAAGQGQ